MSHKKDTTNTILAEIASYGAFLPGSVRKTTEKRKLANGKIKVYEAQPIYTHTDPSTGKQVQKRIPKAAYEHVFELTQRYKGMKKLIAKFDAAAIAEHLNPDSKKNYSL